MVDLEIVPTQDHSFTLFNPALKSHYHSLYGALGESIYVYIEASLLSERLSAGKETGVSILEVGLGTGLNFLLTHGIAGNFPETALHYTAYEPFPPPPALLKQYYEQNASLFLSLSSVPDDTTIGLLLPQLHPSTQNSNRLGSVCWDFHWEKWTPEKSLSEAYDVIYYDAFGPFTAPELWTEDCILAAYQSLKPRGRLVTFSINSKTRRILEKHGITFHRPKGYGGKREMLVIERTGDLS